MDNVENYVQIQVHNKIIERLRQKQLQFKTKVIQLQKQKQYEINRANEFKQKFKQALLSTGASNEMDLIEKLSQKQNQNNALRAQIFRLKRNGDSNLGDGQAAGSKTECQTQIRQLMSQNQQMANTIQQLKNAAISAIISKDEQIEQLTYKLSKGEEVAMLYQDLQQREQSLQKQIQWLRTQCQQQQKSLSDKIAKQRQRYLQKLEEFQDNLHYEESAKQQLIQKASSLECNLQSKEQIIELYQNKVNEYEAMFRQQKIHYGQEKQKTVIQIDSLRDRLCLLEREIANLEKMITNFKVKQKQWKLMADRLKDQNAQLSRKLSIKKRKNSPRLKSSDIYSSFEGISQKSSFYSSFYKPTQPNKPATLGQIQQLQENDVLETFIDLAQRPQQDQQLPNNPNKKKMQALEVDIGLDQPQQTESHDQKQVQRQEQLQQKSQDNQKSEGYQAGNIPQESDRANEAKINPQAQGLLKSQISKFKAMLSQAQNSLQNSHTLNQSLKDKLQQAYTQLQRLNKQIVLKTQQLQKQRQLLVQLRTHNQKSQGQKQLIFELQNFKQHVYKLQNALLIEKLQNAEKQEFIKERNEREIKINQDKINKLNQEIRSLSPKKKKGFFR